MLGQLAKSGTGCFDLVLDSEKCKLAMDIPLDTQMTMMNALPGTFHDGLSSPSSSAMSPAATPWNAGVTPSYAGDWSPMIGAGMTPGVGFSPAAAFSPAVGG